jgi:Zn-dependent protease with chaperone function
VTSSPQLHRLEGISPKAYEHPADRAATAALQAIPMVDVVVRRLTEFRYERAFRQQFLASSVKVGPDQLARVWDEYTRVLETLDMPEVYDLYVTQWPLANAATIGTKQPMIVLNSATVNLLDDAELRTVLAHELGHILSDHVLYTTALLMLLQLGNAVRLPLLAGIPLIAVKSALLEWSRAAELTCDRAATLANRDPLVTCRTLMAVASGIRSEHLNLDAFLRQAGDYADWDSGWDRLTRTLNEISYSHPVAVRRVAEIQKWVQSGDFDRIMGGHYAKRNGTADPRAEAGDAVQYYAERFRAIFRDAGDSAGNAGERLAEWLRGGGPKTEKTDKTEKSA